MNDWLPSGQRAKPSQARLGELEAEAAFASGFDLPWAQPGTGEGQHAEEPGGELVSPEAFELEEAGIIDGDNRLRVKDTTGVPWRWICRIDVTDSRGRPAGAGTGLLISNRHVLTAAHVVHDAYKNMQQYTITVIPALDDLDEPFGRYALASKPRIRQEYDPTAADSLDWDYALLTLGSAVGEQLFKALNDRPLCFWGSPHCGESTMLARLDPGELNGKAAYTAGYPGGKGGRQLWCAAGILHSANEKRRTMYTTADTTRGQSGSPVWVIDNKRHCLVGIAAGAGTGSNRIVRVTRELVRQLRAWITEGGETPAMVETEEALEPPVLLLPQPEAPPPDKQPTGQRFDPPAVPKDVAAQPWRAFTEAGTELFAPTGEDPDAAFEFSDDPSGQESEDVDEFEDPGEPEEPDELAEPPNLEVPLVERTTRPGEHGEALTGTIRAARGVPGSQIEHESTGSQVRVALAAPGGAPIQTACGFFDTAGNPIRDSAGNLVRESGLRTAVVNVCNDEHSKWNTAAGARLVESAPSQLPHLVCYSLGGLTSGIPPLVLRALQTAATTINYGKLPTYGATETTIEAWARSVQPAFIAAPAVAAAAGAFIAAHGTPPSLARISVLRDAIAHLGVLVHDALVFAIKCALEESKKRPPPAADLTTFFWSSVFVTNCVRRAGINLNLEDDRRGTHEGRDVLLKSTKAHRQYVLEAYRRRFGPGQREGTYHAFEPNERAVQKGDVIITDRTRSLKLAAVYRFSAIPAIAQGRSLHGDIVVDVNQQDHYAETIGGNVGESVTRRRYPLGATGKLVVDRTQSFTQEDKKGKFPKKFPGPGNTSGALKGLSTARIFALLSPEEQCRAVLSQPVFEEPAELEELQEPEGELDDLPGQELEEPADVSASENGADTDSRSPAASSEALTGAVRAGTGVPGSQLEQQVALQRKETILLGPYIKDLLARTSAGRAERVLAFLTKWGRNASPFNIAMTYLRLHWSGVKYWREVAAAASRGTALLQHVEHLEAGARALKNAVDQQRQAWRQLPDYPLASDEKAGRMMVSPRELLYVERYYNTAMLIADDAAAAVAKLNEAIEGWDSVLRQAEAANDFTRKSAWEAIIVLDTRIGGFRTYLVDVRDSAARIEASCRQSQYVAADILGKWIPPGFQPP